MMSCFKLIHTFQAAFLMSIVVTLMQALSKKLKDKEEQLREARQKQEELSQLARVKTRTEVQIKQLTDEIGNMRRQRADLLKRIDAEKRRFQVRCSQGYWVLMSIIHKWCRVSCTDGLLTSRVSAESAQGEDV